MVTRPAVEWPPLMDQYLIDLGWFTLPLALSLSLKQRWRELALLSRGLNQSRPLCGQARGGLWGDTKGGLEQLSGSKAFITSRSWPLSTPVELTAFDCLLVLLYLPGVIRLDWHMLKAVIFDNQAGERGSRGTHGSTEHVHIIASVFSYSQNSTTCTLSLIHSVLHCECSYRCPYSSCVFAWFNKFWWNLPTQPLFLSEFDWNPWVNQINGRGLRWHPIFPDSVSHCGEAHGMYAEDGGGGQRASLAFLWCPRPLWRCPLAAFTFEFLSRPNRSVVKYTLKSYEFMNFTQI